MPGSSYGSPEHRRSQRGFTDYYGGVKLGLAAADNIAKGYKAGKYAALAYHGYNLGKKLIGSFSQNKQMPATPPANRQYKPKPGGQRRGYTLMTPVSKQLSQYRARMSAPMALDSVRRRLKFGGRKSIRRGGAAGIGAVTSTSGGKFRKPRGGKTSIDRFAKAGVVFVREVGGIAISDNVTPYQSFTIGHANFGQDQLINDLSYAWAKAIATNAFRMTVEDVSQTILYANGRSVLLTFYYKPSPAAAVTSFTVVLAAAGNRTVAQLAAGIASEWKTIVDNNATPQFTKLDVYLDAVATTPAVGSELIARYDLKRTKFHLYSKSSMKLQNRSINSAGNNEADDVDNVPLYGKSYEGPGNYWQIQDKIYSPGTTIQANYYIGGNGVGQDMAEPLPLSQMKRMKAVGKAHLEAGQIKTSVLVARKTLQVNTLNLILGRNVSTTNMVSIGKQRVFTLEKMIQAVGTDATNGIRLAYEFDTKIGVSCYLPKLTTTTMVVTLNPV